MTRHPSVRQQAKWVPWPDIRSATNEMPTPSSERHTTHCADAKTLPQCDLRIRCIRQQPAPLHEIHTAQLADVNTQPQGDHHIRCMRSNYTSSKQIHSAIRCCKSFGRSATSVYTAQRTDAWTQSQCDPLPRYIRSSSHVLQGDAQRNSLIQNSVTMWHPQRR
jgi:hypothetical protein